MATTWQGWQAQMLGAANLIVTPPNITFMSEWHNHAPGTCNFNPVDLSTAVRGSTRCGATVAGFGRTQNYATHGQAERAFTLQIQTAWVKPLRDALNTGNPFQIGDRSQVIAVLNRWGSPTFATWYANATTDGGSGGGGSGGSSTGTHKGWSDLRKTINKRLPGHVRASESMTAAALRSLHRARRVRL